jgi:hypothetical protein
MMKQTIFKGIRLDEVLAAHCATAAAKAHMPFSQWAREAFQRMLEHEAKRNGKRKPS